MLSLGSIFSGIGGFDLGFEQTGGFETKWQIELDPFCCKVLERHWPNVKRYGDVKEVDGNELEPVDCIVFGSPCQDLSCAGKRAGIEGSRSGLFFEAMRIVGRMAPRWVVWENVRGALSSNGGRDFLAVINAFHRAGYVAQWTTLRASDSGYPHQRARVFVVARLADAAGGITSITKAGHGRSDTTRSSPELAFPALGGLGIVRESSGGNGQTDGSDEAWENTIRSDEAGRLAACGETRTGRPYDQSGGPGGAFDVPNSDRARLQGRGESEHEHADQWPAGADGVPNGISDAGQMADIMHDGHDGSKAWDQGSQQDARRAQESAGIEQFTGGSSGIPFAPPGPADREAWGYVLERWPWLAPAIESGFCRVAGQSATVLDRHRRQRLKALGNICMPVMAQWIAERILDAERR